MKIPTPLLLAFTLGIMFLTACDTEGPASVREGNESFESEDYEQAQEAYERALEAMPANPEATYNSANAFYKQEAYEAAQSGYQQVLEDAAQPGLSQDATFNYARSLHEFARSAQEEGDAFESSQAYEEAKDAYKQVLRLRPNDRQAKYYLERAIEESERDSEEPERQEQQEQEQQEEQEEGQQEDQEQTGPGEQDQQQQSGPQDQQQPQDQQEQDSNQDDSSEETQPEDGESSSTQSPSDPGEVPPTGMTEEQAEQLLESIADNTETLRGRIMSERIIDIPAEREW